MPKSGSTPVSIYALGGLGEVGKNMYCLETDTSLLIIDSGVRFPGTEYPGIDYIIQDYTHLKNNRNKIRALVITHGHEDHIGSIPFLVQSVKIPVIYAPKLAAALIRFKLEDFKVTTPVNIVEYDENSILDIDDFHVTFFRVTHSIPDSFGICIDTPEGRIVTTGDFKVDLTPVGPDIDLTTMARLGSEGVDLLLSDSTNSEQEGFTPSERNVLSSIEEIFDKASGRLIVATFASNISRIQQVVEVAANRKKKICIIGRSMEKAVEISRQYGYIHIKDEDLIKSEELKNYRPYETVILCTGSQGESMSALARIANGEHKDVRIIPGDTVIFSSSAIPGNGQLIDKVVNTLSRGGATVITNSILADIHSSGHPGKQELRLVIKLLKPKYFMPVHGEYRMLLMHADLAATLGVNKENTFIMDNGDTLRLVNHKVSRSYPVEAGNVYIDGTDISGLAEAVIQDRIALTEEGMLTISIGLDPKTNTLIVPPRLVGKGLLFSANDQRMEICRRLVEDRVNELLARKTTFAELKNEMKATATHYFQETTNRTPMVIPLIMNATE